jgi:predicted ATPase
METYTNWYAITGAPCAGKTTVIKRLASLGYATTPEIPRILIAAEIKKGKTIEEIRGNDEEFQKKVLEMKVALEEKIPPNRISFIDDGGVPSSIAYYQVAGLDPAAALEEVKKRRYKKIFFLEQLPYQKDDIRMEDVKTAKTLDRLLRKVYQSLGYDIIYVPVQSVEERVKFILSKVDR